jgi:hypothetical protein
MVGVSVFCVFNLEPSSLSFEEESEIDKTCDGPHSR